MRKHITRFYGRCSDRFSRLNARIRHFDRETGTYLAHLRGEWEPKLVRAQRRRVEWWTTPLRYLTGKGITVMNTLYLKSIRKGLKNRA